MTRVSKPLRRHSRTLAQAIVTDRQTCISASDNISSMGLGDLIPVDARTPGLSDAELASVQELAGETFPPDLCDLLAETLPAGDQFPDWRRHPREAMDAFRANLIEGIHFDVLENGFWPSTWEERPPDAFESRAIVARYVSDAPTLIPLYSHRGIPNEPLEAGNPVFSCVQTDIIIYGTDIEEYLRNEFHRELASAKKRIAGEPRTIRFWSAMLDADSM